MSELKQRPQAWWRYLRFWGSNVRDDVTDEIRFHVDMRVAEYVARGMPEDEARRRAAERFGDADRARDSCIDIQEQHARAAVRAELGSVLKRDVAFGVRVLRRQALPSLGALLAVVALALATIGIYAIMSFFVAQRTKELGLRMALGAESSGLLAYVMRQALVVAALLASYGPARRACAADPMVALRAE